MRFWDAAADLALATACAGCGDRGRIEAGAHPLLAVGVAQLFLRTSNTATVERLIDGAGLEPYLDAMYRKQLERAAASFADALPSIG